MIGRIPQRRLKLTDRLAAKGPRKLARNGRRRNSRRAFLMILDKIEKLLIEESKRPDYRLADYFDYVVRHQHRRNHCRRNSDRNVGAGNS